jgi:SNF2 family DNA or RNA helicase
VACPVSLKINWQDEFFVHSEYGGRVHVMPSEKKARAEFIADVKKRIMYTNEMVIVVANYEQFRIEESFFTAVPWNFVACDEGHRLKNRNAQVTKIIFQIVNGCTTQQAARRKVVDLPLTRVVVATGTPVANTPADLFSLVNIVNPNIFGSWSNFCASFCEMGGFNGHEIVGFRNIPQLREIIQGVMLRRLKEEVAKDLPPKLYQNILVELTAKQRRKYDALKKEFKLGGVPITNPLTQMMVFRQLCAGMQYVPGYDGEPDSAKMDTLLEILDGTDEKVVIWDEFKQTGYDIAKKLGKGTVMFNGDMSVEEKDKAKRAFQEGDAKRFIGTIAAGGVGLTLTAASKEIFYGRTWQPAMNLQAEDRCHRIGQNNNVHIINLVCRDTIEQNIIGRLIEKQADANNVLGEDRPLFANPASFLDLL